MQLRSDQTILQQMGQGIVETSHETRVLSFLICVTLRAESLSAPPFAELKSMPPQEDGVIEIKSEAQVTPASLKQARNLGRSVSVEEIGGCSKRVARMHSRAVSSLRVVGAMVKQGGFF
jgi:hypothetical protein